MTNSGGVGLTSESKKDSSIPMRMEENPSFNDTTVIYGMSDSKQRGENLFYKHEEEGSSQLSS